MAGDRTYTEVLEDIYRALRNNKPPDTNGTLIAILKNQEEMKCDIKSIEKLASENATLLARFSEWRDSHMEETHGTLKKGIDDVNARVNRWIVGNVSLSAIIVALGQGLREVADQISSFIKVP